jgi:hypothetical protein
MLLEVDVVPVDHRLQAEGVRRNVANGESSGGDPARLEAPRLRKGRSPAQSDAIQDGNSGGLDDANPRLIGPPA